MAARKTLIWEDSPEKWHVRSNYREKNTEVLMGDFM